jgi:hypothetical protein
VVLVNEGPEPGQEVGTKRRSDEEVLAGEPREQAVADEPVAEVGRQEAERARVRGEAQVMPEGGPARPERGVGVHHAFRASAGARGEEDQGVGARLREIGRQVAGAVGLVGSDDRDRSGQGGRRLDGIVDHREPGRRRLDQSLQLHAGQARIQRHCAGAQAPEREQLGEELEAIARVEEDPIAGTQAPACPSRAPGRDRAGHRRSIPVSAGQRLDEPSDPQQVVPLLVTVA